MQEKDISMSNQKKLQCVDPFWKRIQTYNIYEIIRTLNTMDIKGLLSVVFRCHMGLVIIFLHKESLS